MAGIDRSDSIRRPVDSTLSTRTAHRGGEGMLQPQRDAIAQLRQSAPAIAVVVEQHDLGAPRKPLYELLLSVNDQWLRVQSSKPFQPGTVLLIEATRDDQIRVLPNPEPAQLNRMMQASLQFWQAHTLPRVHATQLPALPAISVQQQLSSEQPELKPLLDWLSQKPALNGRTLASWVQEFMPLARPQADNSDTPRRATTSLPPISDTKRPSASPAGDRTPAPTANAAVSGQSPNQQTTATLPLQALVAAIRADLPLLQLQPVRWLPLQQSADGQWQPLPQPGSSGVMTVIASPATLLKLAAPTALNAQADTAAGTRQQPSTSVITAQHQTGIRVGPEPLLRIQPVDAVALQQPQRLPMLLHQGVIPAPRSALAALQPQGAGEQNISVTVKPSVSTATTRTAVDALTSATTSNNNAATASFSIRVTTTNGLPTTAAADTEANWQPLPARPGTTERLPLEMRLAQWLSMIDNRIRQHPASLQQSLAQRAQQLLRTNDFNYGLDKPSPPPLPQVHNSAAANPANQQSAAELQPLLQLRNWLEAVQGKTQNNAIQQTLSALAQGGDGQNQPVQQLSIPLVWMGPASWANLEWWQEQASDAADDPGKGGKRLWRFRLFFELEPLAPLCADLVWEAKQTDLTFWSEDRNTLAFLNSQLSTLEQWTEGLGERQLHTRHGMPRKKSTPEPDAFKPLVDVHT